MIKTQIQFLVQHSRNGDLVGKQIKIQLESLKIETGLSRSVLEKEGRPKYIKETWASRLLENMDTYGLSVEMKLWKQGGDVEMSNMDILD